MNDALKIAEKLAEPYRFLVIDDEVIVREVFTECMDVFHCHIECAKTLSEGIYALGKNKFDIVFLDMRLDHEDGMQLLRFVNRHCVDTHVVIMSGSINLGDVMHEANRLGVVSFFAKTAEFSRDYVAKILKRLRPRLVAKKQFQGV
jgi:DNA-binding NtrC family response regulator